MKNDKFISVTPKTYEVKYVENENKQSGLSPAARAKVINRSGSNYLSERATVNNPSYGPGNEDEIKGKGQHLINYLNDKCGHDEFLVEEMTDLLSEEVMKCITDIYNYTTSAGSRFGAGGIIADAKYDGSVYKYEEADGSNIRIANGSLGAEAGAGSGGVTAKARAGVDLINASKEIDGGRVNARVGINADTGGSVGPGGVEAKFLGFGVSVGKKTGLSSPFGEVSVESDDCVIQ
ncbi:hypothetical protein [endosymbiont GvMRE of Glomus versiforme]|uniref:hypothetical protein n=1 Tax=endosymbiont GvMRE of Glomus versiforme TaxID=2039283 RepID=UPI000EEB8660|nr:hypothetical protein [endosymbiont GvMRE of Glomus versiforme]RHZ36419.1 hypothetical protein GvMRE_Ic1g178 [endosymbiont GvMRE of Glomus versiforme]